MFKLQLARYLNRSYWEERNERQTSRDRSSAPASAPVQREELNNYSDQVCYRGTARAFTVHQYILRLRLLTGLPLSVGDASSIRVATNKRKKFFKSFSHFQTPK